MKTKTRILSAVLAILMILAVCPVLSLSAAAPTAWDGKVAGTDMTFAELKALTTKPTVTAADVKDDFDFTSGTMTIKTAAGLALWAAMSSGLVNDSGATKGRGGVFWGATITIANDIDLNNKEWVPINTGNSSGTVKYTLDGAGHTISGMSINGTVASDSTGDFGLIANVFGNDAVTIKNLALMNSTINVDNQGTAYIGGLVGRATGSKTFTMSNCVVDVDITTTVNSDSKSIDYCGGRAAAIGGVAGIADTKNAVFQNVLVSGAITTTQTKGGAIASGLASVFYNGNATLKNIFSNVTLSGASNGATITHDAGSHMSNTFANLFYASGSGGSGVVTGKIKATMQNLLDGAEGTSGLGWTTKTTGGLPVPVVATEWGLGLMDNIRNGVSPTLFTEIDTAEELIEWAESVVAGEMSNARLTANINMTDKEWPIVRKFDGILDGNGYAISNLTVKRLTSTATTAYEATKTCIGGLFDTTDAGATVCNLALIDYTFNLVADQAITDDKFYSGMIFGSTVSTSKKNVCFDNILIYNAVFDTTSVSEADAALEYDSAINSRNGIMIGYAGHDYVSTTNCAFYGKVTDLSYGWSSANSHTIKNSYIVLTEGSKLATGWSNAPTAEKVYLSGAGATLSTTFWGNPVVKANFPKSDFALESDSGLIFVSDLVGSKMGLDTNIWTTYTNGLPVQKVFTDKQGDAADAWSVGYDADYTGDKTEDYIHFLGTAVRTEGATADATAIRFSVEVNTALTAKQYGVMVVPSKALAGGDTILTSALTLTVFVKDLTDHTENTSKWSDRFGAHADQFNVAITEMTAAWRDGKFTVCAFVELEDGTRYYTDAIEVVPSEIAFKAYQANDNRDKMIELYGDLPIMGTPVGTGTGADEANAYVITTPSQLFNVTEWSSKAYVKLGANIDMTGYKYKSAANFAGVFDGCGYVISNLDSYYTTRASADNSVAGVEGTSGGFISKTTGTLKNVAFLGMKVTITGGSEQYAGVLFGNAGTKTHNNIYVEATVDSSGCSSARVGTFSGYVNGLSISVKNYAFRGAIYNSSSILHISSSNSKAGTIQDCYTVLTGGKTYMEWTTSGYFEKAEDVYMTGKTGANNMWDNGGNVTFASKCTTDFFTEHTGAIKESDFFKSGDTNPNLGFVDGEWNYYTDHAPIQSVFANNIEVINGVATVKTAE